MNRIEQLLDNPQNAERADIPILRKEIEKNPYFYSLRSLLLYALKKENHPSFQYDLHFTSIYTNNRKDLYYYLNDGERVMKKDANNDHKILSISQEAEKDLTSEDRILKLYADVLGEQKESNVVNAVSDINNGETGENNDYKTSEDKILEIYADVIREQEKSNEKLTVQDSNDEESVIEEDVNHHQAPFISQEAEKDLTSEDRILKLYADVIHENESSNEVTEVHDNTYVSKEGNGSDQVNLNDVSLQDTSSTHNNKYDISSISQSFNDWLKNTKLEKESNVNESINHREKELKDQLIDDFLEKNPKITPSKKNEPIREYNAITHNAISKKNIEYSDLMTETLAQIYIEQKKYDKAMQAYKILILKYPEKNSYFANQIKEIENLKNH